MAIINRFFGSIVRTGLTWPSRRRLPQTEGTLSLPALSAPVEVIRDRCGISHIYAASADDVEGWQWGRIHRVVFAHVLVLKKPLDQVFNRGPIPIGGDTDTPCCGPASRLNGKPRAG